STSTPISPTSNSSNNANGEKQVPTLAEMDEFRSLGLSFGSATALEEFAKEVKDKKLSAFSSHRTLKDFKEVLAKHGIDSNSITSENAELKQGIDELKKELEFKKNRKFQEKCILIAQILLNEEPIVEYRPSFMEGLELDAFFQRHRIALEVWHDENPEIVIPKRIQKVKARSSEANLGIPSK
ncbi:5616_t:CDS:2, partial [Gigaspora margarita]